MRKKKVEPESPVKVTDVYFLSGSDLEATFFVYGDDGERREYSLSLGLAECKIMVNSDLDSDEKSEWEVKRTGDQAAILLQMAKYLPSGYTVDMLLAEIKAKAGK